MSNFDWYQAELFESPDLNTLDFCLWVWMKSEVHKAKVDRRDESLACIWDAAVSLTKREDQLRRTTRDLHTGVAKCTEV